MAWDKSIGSRTRQQLGGKKRVKPRQVNIVDQRPPSEGPLNDTINPRSPDEEATTRPIEDLVDLLDWEMTMLLRSYTGELSYYHVTTRLCHVTILLCHARDRTIEPKN